MASKKNLPPSENAEQAKWSIKIKETLASLENKDRCALASIVNFKWDKVYIFSENLSAAAINDALGFTWIEDKNFFVDELVDILVFVKDGKVINYIIINGDLFVATDIQGVNRDVAIFEVKTIDDPNRPKVFIPIEKSFK